jgi:hypothetical protein
MVNKNPVKRGLRLRTSAHRVTAQRRRANIAELILRRETILPSELAKIGTIKDSGQSLDLKAAKSMRPGALFLYVLPAIGRRYSSFLGQTVREHNGQPIFILTHKSNGGVYRRLASPIKRKLTRGVRRTNMLVEMRLLPRKIGVKSRTAIKSG